jgi:hypothetical protein
VLLVQHGTRVDVFVNIKIKQRNYSFVQQHAKHKVAIFRLLIYYGANLANHLDTNGWTLMKRRIAEGGQRRRRLQKLLVNKGSRIGIGEKSRGLRKRSLLQAA